MIKCPIKPIYLAFLLVVLYFAVLGEMAAQGLLLGLLVCLFYQYRWCEIKPVLVVLLIAGDYMAYQQQVMTKAYHSAPATITQVQMIPDTISVNGNSLSFRGKSSGRTYQLFYQLTSEREQRFFKNLDDTLVLNIEATLSEAEEQRNFKGFDYRAYLKTQGIYRLVKISKIKAIRLAEHLNFVEQVQAWRRQAIVHIRQSFPDPMTHYMTGLLLGYLDKDFEEMSGIYSSLGIIHLFALSGMQVGFFIGLFRWCLLRIGCRRDMVDWLTLPASVIYAGLTGFSVSVVRSLIQLNLSSVGLRGLDNFAATVGVMLVLMPQFLLTTGGVLSFAYAFILSMIDFTATKFPKLAEVVAIHLGILPILCWYFSAFQPLSILLTALYSFLFDVLILPLLTVVFLLSPLVKVTICNGLFSSLEQGLTWAHGLVSRPLIFGSPSLLVCLMLLVALGLLADFYRKKSLALKLSLVVALLFVISKNPLQNEVTIIDVGQGDSIFLRDMWGKTVLVDVGGKGGVPVKEAWEKRSVTSNAERTVIPYLKSRGVSRIDHLVLTHTDTDHVGDMEEVAAAFEIGEVWVSQGSLTNPAFVERLKAMAVRVRAVTAGDQLPIMGSALQVLYPMQVGDGRNNDSIVLYGRLLNYRFLLTGDLEDGEKELIATYPKLPVDVLKAGHHGSKGSSYPEFLDHINAKVTLVSAGKNNRYHHPNPETLDRFAQRGMTVYRTDQQGAIRLTGWWQWQVETVR